MRFYFTPIPPYTDVTRTTPHVQKFRQKNSDHHLVILNQILWSFWSREGFITEETFTNKDVALMFGDIYKEDKDVVRTVVDFMFEYGMINSREYVPERDGVPVSDTAFAEAAQ